MFSRAGVIALVIATIEAGSPLRGDEKRGYIEHILNQEIALSFDGDVSLSSFLHVLSKKLTGRDGVPVRAVFLRAAFLEVDKDYPDASQITVRFPADAKRMPASTALRMALSQCPGGVATFLVRGGLIEVTTR